MKLIGSMLQFGFGLCILLVCGAQLWWFGRAFASSGSAWSMFALIGLVTGSLVGVIMTLVGVRTAIDFAIARMIDRLRGK